MKNTKDEAGRPVSKKLSLLRFMRYADVAMVTLCLLVLLIYSTDTRDDWVDYLFLFFAFALFLAFALFCITIPIIGLWIYSFAKAITRRTKTDKILLWFHVADLSCWE